MQNVDVNNTFIKKQIEKKEIKQTGKRAGLALFGNLLIMVLWGYFYLRVASYFGISQRTALLIQKEPAFSLFIQALVSLAMLLIPFLIFARCELIKPSGVISFNAPKKELICPTVFAGVGFCLLSSTITGIAGQFFENMGIDAPTVDFDMPEGLIGFLISVVAIAVVPAFVEEFVMRGILMGALKKYGEAFAVIMSAFVFGIMHASYNQIPFAFLVGLAVGIAAIKTNSIWTAVIIHFCNNFISVVFSYLQDILSTEWYLLANSLLFIFILLAASIGISILSQKDKEFFKFNKTEHVSSTKDRIFWFLTAPTVILATVVSLLIATFLR